MCPRRCGVVIARCRTRKDFVLRISARAHIQHNKGKPPTPRVHLVDHSSIRAASAGCRRCGRATQRTLIRTRERCVGIHDHCQQPHPIPSYPDTRNLPLVTLRTRYQLYPTQMQSEQSTYTSYPQLDGEESATESSICQNYPIPKPMAIEELTEDDREILESVSPASPLVLRVRVPSELTRKPNRSFTDGLIC